MITVRRALERHRIRRPAPDAWLTFFPTPRVDPLADTFASLMSLKEIWLPPGAAASLEPHVDGELLTYVREGGFTQEAASRDPAVVQAGEFHVLAASDASRRELNASQTDSAHLFQICLHGAAEPRGASSQQQRFSVAQRRGQLCLVASQDARAGSLRLHQDAQIYSALLEPGYHVVHELSPGRCAWLHLVHGAISVRDVMLATGDGVGVSLEPAISVTTREDSEILIVDMLQPLARVAH
jgi:quercetin 2,3-dioxygenase